MTNLTINRKRFETYQDEGLMSGPAREWFLWRVTNRGDMQLPGAPEPTAMWFNRRKDAEDFVQFVKDSYQPRPKDTSDERLETLMLLRNRAICTGCRATTEWIIDPNIEALLLARTQRRTA